MSYRAPVQDFAGVRTWVQNEYADKGEPRSPYEDSKPKRDRVLPLPSYGGGADIGGGEHPANRTITVVKPAVFNVPSDSNEGNKHEYAISPKPMGKPLHQRSRTLAQSGEEYGHPYMNQGTILNQRRPMTASERIDEGELEVQEGYDDGYQDGYEDGLNDIDADEDEGVDVLLDEEMEEILEDDDTYYAEGYEEGYEDGYEAAQASIHKTAKPLAKINTLKYPAKRQRKQQGQAKLKYQRRYRKNRRVLQRKQKAYYRRNKRRILLYQKRRRNNPIKYQRKPYGGYRSDKQRAKAYRETQKKQKKTASGVYTMMKPECLPHLQMLLACLRAAHFVHWTSHWQVKGQPFYGDHLLMDKIYTSVIEEIDTLAEKIVGYFGPEAVEPLQQIELMTMGIKMLTSQESNPIIRASIVEECLQEIFARTYDKLEEKGCMSLGLDDFIMATANAHETNVYLLRQRLR